MQLRVSRQKHTFRASTTGEKAEGLLPIWHLRANSCRITKFHGELHRRSETLALIHIWHGQSFSVWKAFMLLLAKASQVPSVWNIILLRSKGGEDRRSN